MKKLICKIKNIIIGTWRNITNTHSDLARKRLAICLKCSHRISFMNQYICDQCGCVLESKTRVEDEHCELCKW